MRRVDLEIDRLSIDTLIISRDPRRLILDLALDILKLGEPSVGQVVELCPFWLCSDGMCSMWLVGLVIGWDIDELEDERSTSNDTATSRQEISTNDILEYGRFTRRLRSYNDLWKRFVSARTSRARVLVPTICGRSKLSFPIVLKTKS